MQKVLLGIISILILGTVSLVFTNRQGESGQKNVNSNALPTSFNTPSNAPVADNQPQADIHTNEGDTDVGVIASSTPGFNSYSSKKYGFSFNFPQGWRVGDNSIGWGTFQLFNYDSSLYSGEGFGKGMNKIEMTIGFAPEIKLEQDTNFSSSTFVTVQGQKAVKTVDDEMGHYVVYKIELPQQSDSDSANSVDAKTDDQSQKEHAFLQMVIYGDPANSHVLEELLKSIKWL